MNVEKFLETVAKLSLPSDAIERMMMVTLLNEVTIASQHQANDQSDFVQLVHQLDSLMHGCPAEPEEFGVVANLREWLSKRVVDDEFYKKLCSMALTTLAGNGYTTPEETYGTNIVWAMKDLINAVQDKKWRLPKFGDRVRCFRTPTNPAYNAICSQGDGFTVKGFSACEGAFVGLFDSVEACGDPDYYSKRLVPSLNCERIGSGQPQNTFIPIDCLEPMPGTESA